MVNGKAPFALTAQHHGQSVYDLDNLLVVTPRYHKEILDGGYHFGGG